MKNQLFFILLLVSILFLSCNRQKPQLPANKITGIDTTSESLLKINEALIKDEDVFLANYIAKQDSTYNKHDLGFWYKLNTSNNKTNKPKVNDVCNISYSIYSLQNELLLSKTANIVIGKRQSITAIEEVVKLMSKNQKASLIVPWYLAYGMKGDGKNIKAYTSLLIYVQLL